MNRKKWVIGLFVAIVLVVGVACGHKPVQTQSRELKAATFEIIEGNRWYMKGCYEKAFGHFANAYERYSISDNEDGVARSLNNLGSLYRAKKDWDSALLFFDEAARIYSRMGNYTDLTQTLSNKASVYIDRDMPAKAESALNDADKTARDHGVIYPPLLSNRAMLCITQKKMGDAKKLLATALMQTSSAKPFEYATILHAMGLCMEKDGDHAQALSYYTKALEIDRNEQFVRSIAMDLDAIGSVYLTMGDHENAADYLYRSLKIHTLLADSNGAEQTSKKLKICIEAMGDKKPITRITDYFLKRWAADEKTIGACE